MSNRIEFINRILCVGTVGLALGAIGCGYNRSGALGGLPGSGYAGADLSYQIMNPALQQEATDSRMIVGITPGNRHPARNAAGTVASGGERP
jgi:hypothetical protein